MRCLDSTTVSVDMNLSKFWKIVEDRRAFQATVHTCMLSCISHIQLFVTPWTTAGQAPLSMGFSRQEYWSGLPFPPPGDLPNPGIEPRSPTLQEDSLPAEPQGKPKNTGVGSLALLQGLFMTQITMMV